MVDPANSERSCATIAAANAEALLGAALCARALGRADVGTTLLNEAYGVVGISEALRTTIATALSDPGYGIHPTTAARIDARNDAVPAGSSTARLPSPITTTP